MDGSNTVSMVNALPAGWEYPYAGYHEAPDRHVNILLLLAMGMTVLEVRGVTGAQTETIRKIRRHLPYKEWLNEHRDSIYRKSLEGNVLLAEAQREVSEVLLSLIRDVNAKPSERLAAIKHFNELIRLSAHRTLDGDQDMEPEDRAVCSRHLDRAKIARLME